MTKRELAIRIAGETGLTQHLVAGILQRTLDCIAESLVRGKTVEFRDFGVFEVATRKARIGRNPKKPRKAIAIPARKVVKFKAGKAMKERVLRS